MAVCHMESLYENQEFYIQAIKTYKESYSTAELLKDKYGILHATRGNGRKTCIIRCIF